MQLHELEPYVLTVHHDGPVARTTEFLISSNGTLEFTVNRHLPTKLSRTDLITGNPISGFDLKDGEGKLEIESFNPYEIALLEGKEGVYDSIITVSTFVQERIKTILNQNINILPPDFFSRLSYMIEAYSPSVQIQNRENILLTLANGLKLLYLNREGKPIINPQIQMGTTTDLSPNWRGNPIKPYRIFINSQGGLAFEWAAETIKYGGYAGDMTFQIRNGVIIAGIVFGEEKPTPGSTFDKIKPYLEKGTSIDTIRSIVSPYIRMTDVVPSIS